MIFSLVKPEVVISEQVDQEQAIRNVICTVRANPKPEYVNLYKSGSGTQARISNIIEDETNPLLSKFTRVFTIQDEKDYGEYFCESKNRLSDVVVKSHNVTMERPTPDLVKMMNFPDNRVFNDQSELQWYIKSKFDIIKFEVKISKVTQATPATTKTLLYVADVKPRKTEEDEFMGSFELNNLETDNTYQIGIKAINAYDRHSELEFEIALQKSSSSRANQSFICILLILAISFYHFKNIRLH